MRISDWSSDVCSSDLGTVAETLSLQARNDLAAAMSRPRIRMKRAAVFFPERCRGDQGLDAWASCENRGFLAKDQRLDAAKEEPMIRQYRTEERRVGKECVSPCRTGCKP